jgi:hypothetical protein
MAARLTIVFAQALWVTIRSPILSASGLPTPHHSAYSTGTL